MKKSARSASIITVSIFIAVIFILSALFIILPDKSFSEEENRSLSPAPSFSFDRLADGRFASDVRDYAADQFPFRDVFVVMKAYAVLASGLGENNEVIFGTNGNLITRANPVDKARVEANFAAVSAFTEALAPDGVSVTIASAGRTINVDGWTLPSRYPRETVSLSLGNSNVIDLSVKLRELSENGEYVSYRTDHHWTTLGAYYAYTELAESLGITARPLGDFTREIASEEFYGTTWSKAGAKWIAPDRMEFFRFDGDDTFTTMIVDTGASFAGFYDRSFLTKKDKYSAFLSGNHARLDVTQNEPTSPRDKLLIVKDSFAHSLAPFLAYHFDLVLIDLRYYTKSVALIIREENISHVLILNQVSFFSESRTFEQLRLGLTPAETETQAYKTGERSLEIAQAIVTAIQDTIPEYELFYNHADPAGVNYLAPERAGLLLRGKPGENEYHRDEYGYGDYTC